MQEAIAQSDVRLADCLVFVIGRCFGPHVLPNAMLERTLLTLVLATRAHIALHNISCK